MFEVPQRQQLASVRAPLSLFAPVSSTVSCVPLTRNLSPADPFPTPSKELGTGNALLWYGRDTRCAKRLPMVRDAFSEALGAKNRLLRYGTDIRYRKRPPMVRDAFSEAFGVKNRLLRYGTDIRCKKQAPMVRDAFSEALGAQKGFLWYATHFQKHSVPKTPSYGTRRVFYQDFFVFSLRYGQSDRKGNYHQEQQHADPDGC